MRNVSPRTGRLLQLGFGAAVVVGTVAVVGTGPLIRGVLAISPTAILLAVAFTAIATLAAAWRWRIVSVALGLPITGGAAIAAYYRSQFLNTVLPGGVVGDVHRAYRQGLSAGAAPIGARAVVTERVAGQVAQIAVTAVVLATLGLSEPLLLTIWIGVAIVAVLVVAVGAIATTRRGRRFVARELGQLRRVFREPSSTVSIAVASVVVVAAHCATFVVACLAVGIDASPRDLVGLAVVALAAAALPLSIGGWGPREAVSASAFAVVGLGAGAGLAASTAFGVLTMVSVLPGVIVLVVEWATARTTAVSAPAPAEQSTVEVPA